MSEQPAADSTQGGLSDIARAAQALAHKRWAHRTEPQPEAEANHPGPATPQETAPEPEEPVSESELEQGQDEGDEPEVEGTEQEEGLESEGEEPKEEPAPLSLDDLDPDAVVIIDGEEVKASEVRESRMRQDDYTRKTQALAAQRETMAQREKLVAFALGQQEQELMNAIEKLRASDWQQLSQSNPQEFSKRKTQLEGASMRLQQLREEQRNFLHQIGQYEEEISRQQAKVAQKELKERVKGWNNALYYSLVDYAADNGFDRKAVLKFTDPNVFVMLQKARAYDEAQKTVLKKAVKPSPKRTPQPKQAAPRGQKQSRQLDEIKQKAAQTGTVDAALELLRAKRAAGG